MEDKKKMPAYVFKDEPWRIGDGLYHMTACFPTLGVHVPYTFFAHSENEYFKDVGEAMPCDGSCEQRQGSYHTSFEKEKVIEKAMAYAERQGNPR